MDVLNSSACYSCASKDGVGADVCCFYLSGQTVQMLQQRWHAIVTRELGFKNLDEMQVC